MSVGTVVGLADQLVDVPVTLANATGLGGMDLHLRYDPRAIQFDSAKPAPGPASLAANSPVRGQVKVALLCGSGLATPDFSFILRFRVLAPAGEETRIEVLGATAYNAETSLKMALAFQGGKVQVVSATAAQPPTSLTGPIAPTPPAPLRTPGGTAPRTSPRPASGRHPATSPPAAVASPAPTEPRGPIGAPWTLDFDSMLNLAIATSSGLLVIVLLVGLFWALRPKATPPATGRPANRPADDGPIPLEQADPAVATGRVIAAMADGPPARAVRAVRAAGPAQQVGFDPSDPLNAADPDDSDPLRCPRCRRAAPRSARFCPQCGSPIGQGTA